MIIFIIPLQSPSASKYWEITSALAVRCLSSVLSQTNPNFHVILVCNQPPLGFEENSKLEVICKDYPAPDPNTGSRMKDKWQKVRVGLSAARKYAPTHIMIVDADDLLSNKISDYVNRFQDQNGWIMESGYVHDENSKFIYYKKKEFNKICGSSSIIKVLPSDLPIDEFGQPTDSFILMWGHSIIAERMRERGKPLLSFPFPGVIYITGTGENDSGFSLKKWNSKKIILSKVLNYKLIIKSHVSEFKLNKINVKNNKQHEENLRCSKVL
jgi:hypothetical protein